MNKNEIAKKQSTEAILNASAKILSEFGFNGTTISKVAEEAGVSRGLLHYYFKNKEEMLAKVLRANMEKSVEMVNSELIFCNSVDHFIETLLNTFKSLVTENSSYLKLFLEGLVTARHSLIVKEELGNLYLSFRKAIQKSLQNLKISGHLSSTLNPEALAIMITGLFDGIGIQLLTIEELSKNPQIWKYIHDTLRTLLI